MDGPRISIRREGRGADVCPYCRDALAGRGAVCATCLAVHHVDCWQAHGRCSGCGWTKALMPPEAVVGPPSPALEGAIEAGRIQVQRLADMTDACLLLGARPAEVERLIAAGLVPARGEGDELRFERHDLLRLRERLQERRRQAATVQQLLAEARVEEQKRKGLAWLGGGLALLLLVLVSGVADLALRMRGQLLSVVVLGILSLGVVAVWEHLRARLERDWR